MVSDPRLRTVHHRGDHRGLHPLNVTLSEKLFLESLHPLNMLRPGEVAVPEVCNFYCQLQNRHPSLALLQVNVTEKPGCGFSAWAAISLGALRRRNRGFEARKVIEVVNHVRGQDDVHDILADLLGGASWHVREEAHAPSNIKGGADAKVLDDALPVVDQRGYGVDLCLEPTAETMTLAEGVSLHHGYA